VTRESLNPAEALPQRHSTGDVLPQSYDHHSRVNYDWHNKKGTDRRSAHRHHFGRERPSR